jgi:hypothetical protein
MTKKLPLNIITIPRWEITIKDLFVKKPILPSASKKYEYATNPNGAVLGD